MQIYPKLTHSKNIETEQREDSLLLTNYFAFFGKSDRRRMLNKMENSNLVIAVEEYIAESGEECLALMPNDLVRVLDRNISDRDSYWWYGELVILDGRGLEEEEEEEEEPKRRGWFPKDKVRCYDNASSGGATVDSHGQTQTNNKTVITNSNIASKRALFENNRQSQISSSHKSPLTLKPKSKVSSSSLNQNVGIYSSTTAAWSNTSSFSSSYAGDSNEDHLYQEIESNLFVSSNSISPLSPAYLKQKIIVSAKPEQSIASNADFNPENQTINSDRILANRSYECERDGDLDVKVGDSILVLERRFPKWWFGRNERTGEEGLFSPQKVFVQNDSISSDFRKLAINPKNLQNSPTFSVAFSPGILRTPPTSLTPIGEHSRFNFPCPGNEVSQLRLQSISDRSSIFSRTPTLKLQAQESAQIGVGQIKRMLSNESPYLSSSPNSAPIYSTISSPGGEHLKEVEENPYWSDSFSDDSDEGNNGSNSKREGNYYQSPQLFQYRVMVDAGEANKNLNEDPSKRASKQRFFVICELLDTEKKYIEEIHLILQNFIRPLLNSGLMKASEIKTIFELLQRIYDVNLDFYGKLKMKAQNESNETDSTPLCVGSMLAHYFEQMHLRYQSYGSSLVDELIRRLDEDTHGFDSNLLEISREGNSCQTLTSGLRRPGQRVTKYQLLMERLVKDTGSDHPDKQDCERALECSRKLCKDMNSSIEWGSFRKLNWLQKHITISTNLVDQTIDFNSETRFLGPRILLQSGILTKEGRQIICFLFNDFLLLTKTAQPLDPLIDLFEELKSKTSKLKCTLITMLGNVQLCGGNEHNSNQFKFKVTSSQKQYTLRAKSYDELNAWVCAINGAKHRYSQGEDLFHNVDSLYAVPKVKSSIAEQKPIALFTLVSVEAFQLYSRNYALNAYCKVAMGRDWTDAHSTQTSATVRRVMDFRKTANHHDPLLSNRGFFSKLKSGTRNSFAFGSSSKDYATSNLSSSTALSTTDPHRLIWEVNRRLEVHHREDCLWIRCYDSNPFAPHQFLGEAKLAIHELLNQNRYTNRGVAQKGIKLMPSEEMSSNLFQKLKISPSLLVRFEWAIRTDEDSIRKLYNFRESQV